MKITEQNSLSPFQKHIKVILYRQKSILGVHVKPKQNKEGKSEKQTNEMIFTG